MSELADAIVESEWRKVLREPHARCMERRKRTLLRLLAVDGWQLGRDGRAAIECQIAQLEDER